MAVFEVVGSPARRRLQTPSGGFDGIIALWSNRRPSTTNVPPPIASMVPFSLRLRSD
jgi:hypothetical protein